MTPIALRVLEASVNRANRRKDRRIFTISNSPRVEARVAEQVELIAGELLRALDPGLRFVLLLSGAFGRGEGVAKLEGSVLRIQNDYDFELIIDSSLWRFYGLYKRLRSRIDATAEELAACLQVKQIDVGIKNLELMRRGTYSIALYETVSANRVVAGNAALVRRLPSADFRRIPLTEGARLLLNRGGGLLLAALCLWRPNGPSKRDRANVEVELTKAILACGDISLLVSGRYHFSYLIRAQRTLASRALAACPLMAKLYPLASAYKLKWRHWVDSASAQSAWLETRDLFLQSWRRFEEHRLGCNFTDWTDYLYLVKPRHDPWPLVIGRMLRRERIDCALLQVNPRGFLRGHEPFLLSMLPLLLSAVEPTGVSERVLAPLLTSRVGCELSAQQQWYELARRFLKVWHPGGEAGRVAET